MFRIFIFFLISGLLSAPDCHAKNLHLIEAGDNGYAMYRSGRPSPQDLAEWCRLGISEVAVLSGDGETRDAVYAQSCPSMRIVYNIRHSSRVPLTESFIKHFDAWVAGARKRGAKLLFRCSCGCHRTGRLAAYYEMKHLGRNETEAIRSMITLGESMDRHLDLIPQVHGIADYLGSRPCRYAGTELEEMSCIAPALE